MLLARWRRLSARAVAALLIVPVPFIVDQFGKPAWIQAGIGSVYNWALLLCLGILLIDDRAEEREARAIAGSDVNRAPAAA